LYDSLRQKIMTLPDEVVVYPAHGAGSACGKNMSRETSDTLGHQKQTNYALRADMTREAFIREVTDGLMPPPAYFPLNVQLNKDGYESIDLVLQRGMQALTPEAFEALANETGALILDTRDAAVFAIGFIPNAINIGLNGSFAPWVGALVHDIKQPILLIADAGTEAEVLTRLSRVGYDHTLGFLNGGVAAWKQSGRPVDEVDTITAAELAALPHRQRLLDVRKQSEHQSERAVDARNMPLDTINQTMGELDKCTTWYVHCAGGYRSMIFISILKARGYYNLIDVQGGFKAIKESDAFTLTDYVCPSTLL
jgi:rhodanese-related sulfurtransferase